MNTKKGFTLIELLTVTAILTLLMSMVFFKVTEAKKKGEDAHMKAETTQVARAIHQYKEDNDGKVPGHGITVSSPDRTEPYTYVEGSELSGDDYTAAMQELVTGGYLSEIPTSPAGDDYSYIISADGEEAVFAASLNYVDSSDGGSSGNRNSCTLTQGSGGGNGGQACTEPELPPDIESLYGYSWYYSNFIPGNGSGAYPENLVGSCNQTYAAGFAGDLYDYWNEEGYTCIDQPQNQAGFDALCTCSDGNYAPVNPDATPYEVCQNWGNANCGGAKPGTPGYNSFVYDAAQFANIREYEELYEAPYADAYAEYELCLEDSGSGEQDNGICSGSNASDFCTCI